MGGKRAGVSPQTAACSTLIRALLALEKEGTLHILGLYSHAGQSYSSSARSDALDFLRQEFEALLVTAIELRNFSPTHHPILCKLYSIILFCALNFLVLAGMYKALEQLPLRGSQTHLDLNIANAPPSRRCNTNHDLHPQPLNRQQRHSPSRSHSHLCPPRDHKYHPLKRL